MGNLIRAASRSREAEDVQDTSAVSVNDTISNFDALFEDMVESKRRGMGQKKDTITRFDEIYRSSTPSNEGSRPLSLTGSVEDIAMNRLAVGDDQDCEDEVFEDGEVTLGVGNNEEKEDPEATINTDSGNVGDDHKVKAAHDDNEVDGAVGYSGVCVHGCEGGYCNHNRYN